jgi:magnesium transporter
MLMLDGQAVAAPPATMPPDTVWIDILDGEAREIAWVEQQTGLHVPTLAELSEIESSSRLRTEAGALYLTTPVVVRAGSDAAAATSVGYVLSKDRLITVRSAPLTAFDTFASA